MSSRTQILFCLMLTLSFFQGCANRYITPAAGVDVASVTDEDISELMRAQPASKFPANIAVVRIQASGYYSYTARGYGEGRFSVVTTRDIEEEADFTTISELPFVQGLAPVGRLLLPQRLESMRDLRTAAARLKADLVLIYSIDTNFHMNGTLLGPLSAITLGFLPNKKALVTSTISGVLVDVRTGFVYGTVEATDRIEKMASIWNSDLVVDNARSEVEKRGFKSFIKEYEKFWGNVVEQYAMAQKELDEAK